MKMKECPVQKGTISIKESSIFRSHRFFEVQAVGVVGRYTLSETNSEFTPETRPCTPKGTFIFQPSIFQRLYMLVSGKVKKGNKEAHKEDRFTTTSTHLYNRVQDICAYMCHGPKSLYWGWSSHL